jgi:hypothetical protein
VGGYRTILVGWVGTLRHPKKATPQHPKKATSYDFFQSLVRFVLMHKTNFGDEKKVQHKHKSHFVFVLHKHKISFGNAPLPARSNIAIKIAIICLFIAIFDIRHAIISNLRGSGSLT